jgi:Na+-driven multidrug efflux pump
MLHLWLPLAASIVMMVLEPSIINVALGRTSNPELALAAFGVAFSIALLIEAPVIMLLDASVARSTDREAFSVLRRFSVVLGLVATGIGLLVSFTPLYGLIVKGLMNMPSDVADLARPTLKILSFWYLPIGWRRTHQGVLIRAGHTSIITVATGVRLLTLAFGVLAGLLLFPDYGAVIAGLAMVLSVTVEAVVITLASRPGIRAGQFGAKTPTEAGSTLTMRGIWRFYRPLVVTTFLRQTTRPALNIGIAAASMPRASLAAWPVAWGVAILITGPAWSLQQLTTALATDERAAQRVMRFDLVISALFSLILGLVAFTPLYGLVMGGIYNLSPSLQELARPAIMLMAFLPLLMGAQSFYRGLLIRAGSTGVVRTAMIVNVGTVLATMVVSSTLLSFSGVTLAAFATTAGGLAELGWLWKERPRLATLSA